MKLLQPVLLVILTSSIVIEAAPRPVSEFETKIAISKRQDLEKSLQKFIHLWYMRTKGDEISTELMNREYAIVTDVLTTIKDTDLAPTVLKFFVENNTLSSIAIDGIVFIVKSGVLSVRSLLSLLVQSGLITSVLNDILGDCGVYTSLLYTAESSLKSLFKRESDHEITDYINHKEGLKMLHRDGLLSASGFYYIDARSLDVRDIDGVFVNILESIASSGLGTQVLETVLTDTEFLSFGAKLIQTLYADNLISLSSLVAAITESGIIPHLLKEILNFRTLETIAKTAISAATGKCSTNSGVIPTKIISLTLSSGTGSSTHSSSPGIFPSSASQSATSSSMSSLLGFASSLNAGKMIFSEISGILDNFFRKVESTKPANTLVASTKTSSTAPATSLYACSKPSLIRQRKRKRLY